jgi:deoxyribose-phosphate aldolase
MEPKVDLETKIRHIQLIREAVGDDFPIKAAGSIKTMVEAQKAVAAGANIIGTSSGVEIIKGEIAKEKGE